MDSRNFIRFNVGVSVRYRVLESLGFPKDSKTEDMSESGIRMTVSDYVPPETRLELTVNLPSQTKPILAVGRVVWVKAEFDNQFTIGVQLTYIRKCDKESFYQYALL